MFRLLPLSFLALMSSSAMASDLDGSMLRGDLPTGSIWEGTYAGGSLGYSNYTGSVAGQTIEDVRFHLKGTATLAELKPDELVEGFEREDSSITYGAVIGHNWAWDGVIFGLEAAYDKLDMSIGAERETVHLYKESGTNTYMNAQVRYGGKVKITDMASLKGRIGYDAGDYMPYLSLGGAVIRGDTEHYSWIASGDTTGAPAITFPARAQFRSKKKNEFGFGLTGGFGVDYMIASGLMLRGEYEITRIDKLGGGKQDFQAFKSALMAKF